MRRILKFIRAESGISYIEVLIAVVILGISSTSLLNAISSNNQVADKYTDNQISFSYISTAGEIIAKEEYLPCNDLTPRDINGVSNPYASVANYLKNQKNPMQIMEVMAIGSDKQWHLCGDSFWSNSTERPSLFQRIKICIPDSSPTPTCATNPENENYNWRYIFKNLGKITSGYSVKASTTNYCNSANSNSYNIVSGYVKNISLLACSNAYVASTSTNLVFYTIAGSGPQAIASSCSVSDSTDLSIAISGSNLSICPGKKYVPNADTVKKVTIEIGAIDINNSIYYNPISLAINTYYPPTLVTPSTILTESQVSLFGCTTSSAGCATTSLSYVGGIPDTPVYFGLTSAVPSSSSINGGSNFAIDTNKGDLSLTGIVTNSGTTPGSFAVTIALSGGGLPYAANQIPFDVTVNPLINLAANSSMGCALSACSASFQTLPTSGLFNFANLNIKSSDSTVVPSISNPVFNSTTSQWSFTVSASFTCKTYTVGSGRNAVTYYYPLRSTFNISDSVASATSKYSTNSISFSACA